jgi:hypothetical protein
MIEQRSPIKAGNEIAACVGGAPTSGTTVLPVIGMRAYSRDIDLNHGTLSMIIVVEVAR